jgi:hypothetical protein
MTVFAFRYARRAVAAAVLREPVLDGRSGWKPKRLRLSLAWHKP